MGEACPLCGSAIAPSDARCPDCNMTLAGIGARAPAFTRHSVWVWAGALVAIYLVVLAIVAAAR
jgi:predicted nucleic acid-binding Zn ribbon protein